MGLGPETPAESGGPAMSFLAGPHSGDGSVPPGGAYRAVPSVVLARAASGVARGAPIR
jgi:hypothetical protein